MTKYVYIGPDSPHIEDFDALTARAQNEDNMKLLNELREDEFSTVYNTAAGLVAAFNEGTLSDLGYILTLNV